MLKEYSWQEERQLAFEDEIGVVEFTLYLRF
jgi:hypothetical protein